MQIFVVGSFVVACSATVARLPRAGESLNAAAFVSEPGGKGFNLAVASRRLGGAVEGAFAVGNDAFATLAEAAFAEAGLSRDCLFRYDGSTGAGVGFVDGSGENCLAVCLGANADLTAMDVARNGDAIASARLVMATFESPDPPIQAAFARARAHGAETLLNPSPSRTINPAILADTTLLVVNQIEAADLGLLSGPDPASDDSVPAPVEALMQAGPRLVVITLGAQGAVAYERGGATCRILAFPVAIVDTIGAGDAFSAGLAIALLQDRPLPEILRRAAACGALTASKLGAFRAFPTEAELDRFLVRAGPPSAEAEAATIA